jgi:Uma2 family endonuclease
MLEPETGLPSSAKVKTDPDDVTQDRRFVIYNLSWDQYCAIREATDHTHVRLTYLNGRLELMSPGRRHELATKVFARLIEIYALEKGMDLNGYRSMTFKEKPKAGFEPDECYTMGVMPEEAPGTPLPVPNMAFESVVTGVGEDKLEVYLEFRVPEVWFWLDGEQRFSLYRLGAKGYERIERSGFLPGFDFELVAKLLVSSESQLEVVRRYRNSLRGSA